MPWQEARIINTDILEGSVARRYKCWPTKHNLLSNFHFEQTEKMVAKR